MGNIFITGSADGLGAAAADRLRSEGHRVVRHARNAERARQAFGTEPSVDLQEYFLEECQRLSGVAFPA